VIFLQTLWQVFLHLVRIIGGILTTAGRVQNLQDFRQYLVIPPGHLTGSLLQPSVAAMYWQSSRLSFGQILHVLLHIPAQDEVLQCNLSLRQRLDVS